MEEIPLPILPTTLEDDPFVTKMRNMSTEVIANKQFIVDTYLLDVEAHQVTYKTGKKYIHWNIICNTPMNVTNTEKYDHPFLHITPDDENQTEFFDVGGVVADNILTRSKFYSLINIDKLETGNASKAQYCASIIRELDLLWD